MSNIPVKTNQPRRPLAHRIGAVLGALIAAAGILVILVIAWGCIAVGRQIIGA